MPKEGYGAALVYFTDGMANNIALRRLVQNRELRINEYGVFHDEGANFGPSPGAASLFDAEEPALALVSSKRRVSGISKT